MQLYRFTHIFELEQYQWRVRGGGGGGGGLRVLEHPPQLWYNSQISSSVATVYADNQQLHGSQNQQ